MKRILLSLLPILPFIAFAQHDPACFVEKDFLIIHSTKNYKSALTIAQKAAKTLNIKLNLRGLLPISDTTLGLSEPIDTCLKYSEEYGGVDSTCYLARGRWDDGIYISIEFSNAYNSFARGYYIVMVGSASKKEKNVDLAPTLKKIKVNYPEAYIKTSKVYLCCMH